MPPWAHPCATATNTARIMRAISPPVARTYPVKKTDDPEKQTVFRQLVSRRSAVRRYARLKNIKLKTLLDRLCEPVVEAGRLRGPNEEPPVDPFPDMGRPLDPCDH